MKLTLVHDNRISPEEQSSQPSLKVDLILIKSDK